jgi:hypothetical protein
MIVEANRTAAIHHRKLETVGRPEIEGAVCVIIHDKLLSCLLDSLAPVGIVMCFHLDGD